MSNINRAYGMDGGRMEVNRIEYNSINPLRGVAGRLMAGTFYYRQEGDAIRSNVMLPDAGRAQALADHRDKYTKELFKVEAEALGHATRAIEDLKEVRKAHGYDGDAGTRALIRDRIFRLLDSGVAAEEVIEEAAAQNDRGTLSVMRDEYYIYERSNGNDRETAQKLFSGIAPQLDTEEARIAGGDFAKAVQLEQELQGGLPLVRTSLNYVRGELDGDDGAADVLPAFDGSVVEVPDHRRNHSA